MLENNYQAKLIKTIRKMFPGCEILKNDSSYQPGIPDLSIFWRDRYAFLEVKKSSKEKEEPGQSWFVDKFNEWSFGAFIYPENEKEILDALQQSFSSPRTTRVP